MSKNNTEENSMIKISKKSRFVHRFSGFAIGVVVVAVLAVGSICAIKFVSINKVNDKNKATQAVVASGPAATTAADSDQIKKADSAVTNATTQAAVPASGKLSFSSKAEKTELTSKDALKDTVFVGDSVMYGISFYKYLDEANVVADQNMTASNASNKVSDITKSNPKNVVIMLGLNDANYQGKKAEDVAFSIESLVKSIKSANSATKVYVMSVLPVTQAFESGNGVYVKQSFLNDLNKNLESKAASAGYSYIDAASAFADNTGYMDATYTSSGSNIKAEYYPFLLNSVSKLVTGR